MSKNYVKKGERITHAHTAAVVSGQAVLIGAMLGVAETAAAANADAEYATTDVYTLPALTGTAWAKGAQLYWDDTNKRVTNVASGNTACGKCWNTKASADATCQVKLNA